eukprot:4766299-Alexandrium_andersonii.AAC.1
MAPDRRNSETPILQVHAPGSAARGVSDFRRFGTTEKAVGPIWRAGTAAHSGWTLGPRLTLTNH